MTLTWSPKLIGERYRNNMENLSLSTVGSCFSEGPANLYTALEPQYDAYINTHNFISIIFMCDNLISLKVHVLIRLYLCCVYCEAN